MLNSKIDFCKHITVNYLKIVVQSKTFERLMYKKINLCSLYDKTWFDINKGQIVYI